MRTLNLILIGLLVLHVRKSCSSSDTEPVDKHSEPTVDISGLIEHAVDAQRSGKVAESRELYTRILQLVPDHAHALHNLGILFYTEKNYDASIQLISQAIRHLNLPSPYNGIVAPCTPSALALGTFQSCSGGPGGMLPITKLGADNIDAKAAEGFLNSLGVVYRGAGGLWSK